MPINNKDQKLNDALSFLVACCQIDPSKEDIAFISSYLNAEHLDINNLIKLANQHGILPLVHKSMKNLHIESQEHFLKNLKSSYTQIAQRNMLMSAELIRIVKLLEENGIQTLPFKGPALSQIAYDDITLRQYVDLDILTKKEDVYKIDALLKSQGYERLLALTAYQEKIWVKYAHDMGFIHPTKGVHLEMCQARC